MFTALNQPATQTTFGKLVGVSQQSVSKRVDRGELPPGGSLADWLHAYCEQLRKEAAGRGGEEQQIAMAKARTREAEANAQLKELQFFKEVGQLVPVEEIEVLLSGWATVARSEVSHALEKMVAAIESRYQISIDQSLIDEPAETALAAIADYPRGIAAADDEGGEQVGATA